MTTELEHIGIERKSGRYPWGSGGNPEQRHKTFLTAVEQMKAKGLSQKEIAEGMGISTTEFVARRSAARKAERAANVAWAEKLAATGMSPTAIGREMGGINESTVRSYLDPATKDRQSKLDTTIGMLKEQSEKKPFLDIGLGTEHHIGVSETMLKNAVINLKDEGYEVMWYKQPQAMGNGQFTNVKVLAAPGKTYKDLVADPSQIKTISDYSEDGGRTFAHILPPVAVSSKRVGVRYAEEGGSTMDGTIQLRRGVDDISLGNAKYAQVRIQVDETHYLKGMAMYGDDLPPGIDLMFNTNKSNTGNKLDALKKVEEDSENPFGSTIRQKHYEDKRTGERKLSPLNIVGTERPDGTATSGEEGGWLEWKNGLSSQFLSKQTPALAKQQLDVAENLKRDQLDEILALNNPAVKKRLLESFADDADAAASRLQAAGLPRTASHVILPINSLKDNEIYAPNYNNGETVVLVRHPHGGIFEIPELKVNNKNPEAKRVMEGAKDAVGINSKVAERLSGADFDGDTVLVIPNPHGVKNRVRVAPQLEGLKDFNPKEQYKKYEGMERLSAGNMQTEMGKISNLITDMSIKQASSAELARAVRHSMVIIDANKHYLNYKQSAKDNGINELKKKYQTSDAKKGTGAATLVSRSTARKDVLKRRPQHVLEETGIDPATGKKVYKRTDGAIDKTTGKKVFVQTGESYVSKKTGKTVFKTERSEQMREVDDAFKLSSGTVMEAVYANHANSMKAMANKARQVAVNEPPAKYEPSAKAAYSKEVDSLNHKLNAARYNKPLERQAQIVSGHHVTVRKQADPSMTYAQEKKIRNSALQEVRQRVGAERQRIEITPSEWKAIQAGAISDAKLQAILSNTDLEVVKAYATPRDRPVMTPTVTARAKAMLAQGRTPAEVAKALGISTSTLNSGLK